MRWLLLGRFVLMIISLRSSASKDFADHLTFCLPDSDPKCNQHCCHLTVQLLSTPKKFQKENAFCLQIVHLC